MFSDLVRSTTIAPAASSKPGYPALTSFPQIGFSIDVVPAILVLSLLFSLASLVAALTSRVVTLHAVFWAVGGISIAAGLLLLVLRGAIPDIASILIGNWLLLLGHGAMGCGASRYAGRSLVIDVALALLFAALFAVASFAGAGISQRVGIVALALVIISVRAFTGFLSGPRRIGSIVAMTVLIFVVVFEAGRALTIYAHTWIGGDPERMTGVAVGLSVPVAMGMAIGIAAVNWPAFRRLSANFRKADESAGPGIWQLASDSSTLITPDGQRLRLTGNEYVVLQRLRATGEPIDRLTLNALIGRDTENPKDRGIDILLSRLRRKCADARMELPVTSIRGRGYVFPGGLPEV